MISKIWLITTWVLGLFAYVNVVFPYHMLKFYRHIKALCSRKEHNPTSQQRHNTRSNNMTFKEVVDSGKWFRRPSMTPGLFVRFNIENDTFEKLNATGEIVVYAGDLNVSGTDYELKIDEVKVTREMLTAIFNEIPRVRTRAELVTKVLEKLAL